MMDDCLAFPGVSQESGEPGFRQMMKAQRSGSWNVYFKSMRSVWVARTCNGSPRRRLNPRASAGKGEGEALADEGGGRSWRARVLPEGEGAPGGWEGVDDQVQVSL